MKKILFDFSVKGEVKRKIRTILLGTMVIVLLAGAGRHRPQVQPSSAQVSSAFGSGSFKVDQDFGKMPLYFISNQGQMDSQVAYYIQGKNKAIYFTSEGLTYVLNERGTKMQTAEKTSSMGERILFDLDDQKIRSRGDQRAVAIKLDFVKANANVRPSGDGKTETVISYFKGKPTEWNTGLPTYSRIVYKDLWPGIDAAYYGTVDKMKYEFVVHPGADPSLIQLAYRGASAVEVNGEGRLEIKTPTGGFVDDRPAAYQEFNGDRVDVAIRYLLGKRSEKDAGPSREKSAAKSCIYGFAVGDYDKTQPLVLDPAVLIYCGFIGGSDMEEGRSIALDSSGCAYVTGHTFSSDFPVTAGAYDAQLSLYEDIFIAKISATGSSLAFATFIGGSNNDRGYGIALDATGNIYVTGWTNSTNFPVTSGAFDTTYNPGYADWHHDAFVSKLNPVGSSLIYSTYLGGNYNDSAYGGIVVDGSGCAYVSGYTSSSDFPTTSGAFQLIRKGHGDAFITKFNSAGSGLVFSTLLGGATGGNGDDGAGGIAVDSAGAVYVTGDAGTSDFPTTAGAYDTTFNGGTRDVFISKFNASGTDLVYSTFVGSSGEESVWGFAVDGNGNAYAIGEAFTTDFPTTAGAFDITYNGGDSDVFVSKLNAAGSALSYSAYLGGSDQDCGWAIAVDAGGGAYVAGLTYSTEATFPVIGGPDLTHNGAYDAFVAKVNASGSSLVYCGYIGGNGGDEIFGIAVAVSGNVYVTGKTSSTEATFPVSVGPDLTFNSSQDAFVAKISPDSTISVTSPNGGESWTVGSNHNITWTSTGSFANVGIDYSTNNGTSWTWIDWETFNDGTFPWTVPNTPSITCLVRIRDAVDGDPSDSSNAAFTISAVTTETVSAPSKPAGANFGLKATSYPFTTGGSISSLGHAVQYKINWNDGSDSGWLATGTTGASHSWAANGTYDVRAMARCVSHTTIESLWSTTHAIIISDSGTLGKYNSPSQYKVLPEVIWASATGGGTWMSEVQITDISGGSQVSVYYSTSAGLRGKFLLWNNGSGGALRSQKYANMLQTIDSLDSGAFTYTGTVGAVLFLTQDAAHVLQVSARTKNGNYSKTFSGLSLHDSNTADTSRVMVIPNLTNNSTYRSSCGMYNISSNAVTVELRLLNAANSQIGSTITKTLNGYGFSAFSPFSDAGRPYPTYSYDNVIVKVQPVSGTGKVVCFGASANNTSNDPAAHFAVQNSVGHDNGPSSKQILPEAIWATATGGGTWKSEAQIIDVSGGSAVSVYFDYGGGSRRGPFVLWTGGVAGSKVKYANILQQIGTIDGGYAYFGKVGAVEFRTQDSAHIIQVTARTLNGNYSKTFPGLNLVEAETADASRMMLIQNYANNSTYRSTSGFFNATGGAVTVEFTLLNNSGAQVGTPFNKTFVGYDFQAFSPFTEAGVPYPANSYDNVILWVRPTSGSSQVICFGASANNASNDPAAHLAVQWQ